MNKLFSKVATLSVGLAMAIGVGVAVGSKAVKEVKADEITATWDASKEGFSNQQSVAGNTYNFDDSNVTISFGAATGNGHKYYTSGAAVRSYGDNSFTIASTAGNLKKITLSNDQSKTATASVGTLSGNNWTGDAESVTFTVASGNGNFRTSTVTAIYDNGGSSTKYSVIDRVDYGTLNKNEVYEGATLTVTIVPDSGYELPETLTSVLMAGSPVEYTYSNGVVTVANVQGNVTIEAECPKIPQQTIQSLYSKSSGELVDVYGYYVGFLDGTGPVIMDGEYGIVVYNKSADVSGYTERETILHVNGSISIYNGLYEIGSSTIAVASGSYDAPAAPVVYAAKGGETAEYASRLTTVTGVPTVTSGSFDSDAGKADIKMNFTVGANTVQIFYKKAVQLADAETYAAVKAAVEGESEITIKGFTGWYNGFQVQMNGYIAPAEDYTAEEFAQDLLTQTNAVCTGWKEGDNNHDALEAIWTDLASADKYPALPAAQKTILAEAARDPEGTDIEKAMARYDFLTGKYNLSNFINGRTPVATANTRFGETDLAANNNTMIIIISVAAVSALAFTMLLVFKKKKQK